MSMNPRYRFLVAGDDVEVDCIDVGAHRQFVLFREGC